MTADAWPSPSQVGEDEAAWGEVLWGGSGAAVALARSTDGLRVAVRCDPGSRSGVDTHEP